MNVLLGEFCCRNKAQSFKSAMLSETWRKGGACVHPAAHVRTAGLVEI